MAGRRPVLRLSVASCAAVTAVPVSVLALALSGCGEQGSSGSTTGGVAATTPGAVTAKATGTRTSAAAGPAPASTVKVPSSYRGKKLTKAERLALQRASAVRAAITSAPGWRAGYARGHAACAGLTAQAAFARLLAAAKTADSKHPTRDVHSLLYRISQLKGQVRTRAAAPVAAMLLSQSVAPAQRAGAFNGCETALKGSGKR